MIEGIIFDLDGTLWNTLEETFLTVNEVADKYKIDEISEETIKNGMGFSNSELAEKYMPKIKRDDREKIFREMTRNNVNYLNKTGGKLYPKVKETLEDLSFKYKLFIVSNCGAGYIESFLESNSLEYLFKDFIAASRANISKTEAINRLKDEYNLKNVVYVGDTLGDYEYATRAKVPFVHAKYGFNENLECRYKIDRFEELPECLEKVEEDL